MRNTSAIPTKYWIGIICLLIPQVLTAQFIPNAYYDRLFYLCKVWGHAKYYHNEVANGNVDWDDALLEALPAVKAAESNAEFNAAVLRLLESAGVPQPALVEQPQVPDSLNNNLDLSWMEDSIFNDSVQATLRLIWDRAGERTHVKLIPDFPGAHADFEFDNQYATEEDYPSEEKRILALFRYWNIIHYFYPFKHVMDQDWDTSLRMHLTEIVSATDALAYHQAMTRLVVEIDDSHGFYSSPTFNDWLGLHWPPFEARFIDDELVVTKVLPGIEGLAPGDVIRTIDLQPVASWVEEFTPYANASNEPTRARNLMRMIIRGQAGPFDMTVFDGQQERTYSLTRDFNYLQELNATEEPIYRVEYQNGCRVGRIDMERLAGNQIEDMFTLFEQTDAIIFDIRNYPNPILWDLVSYLHPTPFDFLKFTTPNLNFAGHFSWREERFDQVSTNPYAGQVFILFDEYTQSLAELTVMSLEPIPGSVKVGSTTAAAFGNISYIVLPGNIRTAATFFGVHYPDYSPTHRVGNVPDVEVRPTVAGIRAGRDEVLEAAYSALDVGACIYTSLPPLENPDAIRLYPNPVQDQAHYTLSPDLMGQPLTLQILDAEGKTVYDEASPGLEGTLELTTLESGIYVLRIATPTGQASRLLFKQ